VLTEKQQPSAPVVKPQSAQATPPSVQQANNTASSTTFTGEFTTSTLFPERFQAQWNVTKAPEQKSPIISGLTQCSMALIPDHMRQLDEKVAQSTPVNQNQTGQQNQTQQDDQQGGVKTLTVSEFLDNLLDKNGVVMTVKKSISDIKTVSDVRKCKNELEKLIKKINPLFKEPSKKASKAVMTRQTKLQNQWAQAVHTWLNTLNQSESALVLSPTEEFLSLDLTERKAIIGTFSDLLKDLNQQNKTIIKANREKKLAEQAQRKAKKKAEKALDQTLNRRGRLVSESVPAE
jgi:hypothetical protein